MNADNTKMTFKVAPKIRERFDNLLSQAMFKRDALLAHVLKVTTPELLEFAMHHRNSDVARQQVANQVRLRHPKALNIVLPKATAKNFNDAIETGNYCRDAVFNRILFLLAPPPTILQGLTRSNVGASELLVQDSRLPLDQVVDMLRDPFGTYRDDDAFGEELWSFPLLGEYVSTVTCFVEDANVPGTTEYNERQRMWDEL